MFANQSALFLSRVDTLQWNFIWDFLQGCRYFLIPFTVSNTYLEDPFPMNNQHVWIRNEIIALSHLSLQKSPLRAQKFVTLPSMKIFLLLIPVNQSFKVHPWICCKGTLFKFNYDMWPCLLQFKRKGWEPIASKLDFSNWFLLCSIAGQGGRGQRRQRSSMHQRLLARNGQNRWDLLRC